MKSSCISCILSRPTKLTTITHTHLLHTQYFPDRFVRKEIKNLVIICPFSEMGCNWEGKFEEYQRHVEVCDFVLLNCEHCGEKVCGDQMEKHTASCPCVPKKCPLAIIGCRENLPMAQSDLRNHLRLSEEGHLTLLVSRLTSLEKLVKKYPPSVITHQAKQNTERSLERRALPSGRSRVQYDFVERDGPTPGHSMTAAGQAFDSGFGEGQDSSLSMNSTKYSLQLEGVNSVTSIHTQMHDIMQKSMHEEMKQAQQTLMIELRSRDDEIASLKATVNKLEKTVRSKNAELEDRDFRLSLIENGNHDGSMIWKIPQFSQRKDDAENGKYTSIFSLPFYSGRYGYKMCLRLYIMGDGIGKGTHLSLFFVVMRGEFDNILQWPFTHKVTFKLINQAGGRDIVDTFQPDPMSSSFRKPKSDMNIASGCPRFVSHTELERGGFIVDDTIFIKCMIDTSTVHHP